MTRSSLWCAASGHPPLTTTAKPYAPAPRARETRSLHQRTCVAVSRRPLFHSKNAVMARQRHSRHGDEVQQTAPGLARPGRVALENRGDPHPRLLAAAHSGPRTPRELRHSRNLPLAVALPHRLGRETPLRLRRPRGHAFGLLRLPRNLYGAQMRRRPALALQPRPARWCASFPQPPAVPPPDISTTSRGASRRATRTGFSASPS